MFLVCGEALFDFFLEREVGPAAATYDARAGGSPFNVAIGLARLGQASGLLTGLSTDLLGQRLAQVLADEGVSTAYAIATDRPTTLSLVGLDTHGVPAYQFYDNGSADTGVIEADLPALGPEVSGLHLRVVLARGRRRSPTPSRRSPRATATASSRSTRTSGRRSSPTWTSGASGWPCSSRSPMS